MDNSTSLGTCSSAATDLAISPSRNVGPQNPGFESFVGQFKSGE